MATTYAVDELNLERTQKVAERVLSFTGASTVIPATMNQVSPVGTITSGALSTQQLVSGTGAQVSTTRDVETHTPCTSTSAAPAVTVAISPDNVTYSTLCVASWAINAAITDIVVRVPAGWFIKLTAVNATLGVTTFY
jgi:hypothetical protein